MARREVFSFLSCYDSLQEMWLFSQQSSNRFIPSQIIGVVEGIVNR